MSMPMCLIFLELKNRINNSNKKRDALWSQIHYTGINLFVIEDGEGGSIALLS